jgi:hypothetical protein
MTKDLHQLFFVSTSHHLVVEVFELGVAHVCEHLSRQLCIRRGAAGL